MPAYAPVEDRLWRQVSKGGPDDCWLWTAHTNNKGYGMIGIKTDGRFHKALSHRVSWELQNGPIPKGMKILHRCDTPRCVNPAHLFVGTMKDNTDDMVAKGRSARGEMHGNNKLSANDVRMIRATYADGGVTQKGLAAFFDVTKGCIGDIVRNTNWQWLPQPKEA